VQNRQHAHTHSTPYQGGKETGKGVGRIGETNDKRRNGREMGDTGVEKRVKQGNMKERWSKEEKTEKGFGGGERDR